VPPANAREPFNVLAIKAEVLEAEAAAKRDGSP
jgi:hypothetical protein